MAVSNNLAIQFLEEGQSQKEATINTAFQIIDKLISNYTTQTTNNTPTNLSIPNADFSNDTTYFFDGAVVARNTLTDTESKVFPLQFLFRRGSSAANSAIVGSVTTGTIIQDTGTTTWTVTVTADTTNGKPQISVTGEAGKTISWKGQFFITRLTA